ncbi:hypothetical protein GOP47_0027511 [Adiantum capillus-veneris]|nr:hypothetical protein GOP47_0027511 [Adiantum capillus-veneris]
MEELYSEELRTPPMPLAALVGVPELHSTISTHLHMEALPINILALPDFSKISVLTGKERRPADAKLPPPLGILKVDWLRKHRTRVPAALVVLLSRDEVYGDPAQWLQVCTHLDDVKNMMRGRNTKLIVVVVQPTVSSGDAVEERMMTLRKRAEVNAKCFLTFISQEPSEQKRSLARLGNILGELVTLFYKDEGRRIKLRMETKAFSSNELSVRYNFKVAVYAEFRRDWVEALKYYESAYALLQEVVSTPMEMQPVQRRVEFKTVAEQLHFKVSTLLLHGGKEVEAAKWFRQHMSFYKPLVGPSEGSFLHWSWVSKQFLVFGVLLQNSLTSVMPVKSGSSALLPEAQVTERELQPGYYYQLAAHYMIQRRQNFQLISSNYDANDGDVLEGSPEDVGQPLYVGQSPRILTRGSTLDTQCPTDQEYMLHAVIKEKLFPHSASAITLLKRAYELYKSIQAGRMSYFIACEMGREYFSARDYINAKTLFDTVAGMYRQESWVSLLWATLGFLRECARQLGHLQEYIEYSLEMAALPTTSSGDGNEQEKSGFNRQVGPAGPFCHLQRDQISSEVLNLLHGKQSVLPSRDGEAGLTVGDSDRLRINIDVASPLRAVLAACVAFHEPTVKPGTKASLTLSLLTHLPQSLVFEELEVCFNQPTCNLVLVRDTHGVDKEGFEVRTGFDLHLEPNRWTRFSFDLNTGQSGKLECLSVTARLGGSTSIMCQVESPASRDDVIYWKLEPRLEMMPFKNSALSHYGQKTVQVEEQDPMVNLVLEAVVGPALVNELFPINIIIRSKGHSVHAGEIKFSTAEASMTLLITSPRTPSIPFDMSFVELLVPNPSQDTKQCELELLADVLHVPAIATEGSFSTQMYMRWKEAKAVSLFAAFSYQTETVAAGLGAAGHPHRYFVHRGLQLQCEEPFTLSHRYMPPFRRDALLLGSLQKVSSRQSQKSCVPIHEVSTLMVTMRNSSSVNLQLIAVTVEEADGSLCSVKAASSTHGKVDDSSLRQLARQNADLSDLSSEELSDATTIVPGETFTSLFYVQPVEESRALAVGTVCINWKRLHESDSTQATILKQQLHSSTALPASVHKLIPLPPLQVEKPVVLATLHCPPHAILGVPFDISLGVQNLTALIQEIDFSVVDSTGFILSGAHSDSIHILPYAKNVISCKLVPIVSGPQQLPQFNLIAKRYNAGFQQSLACIQIFVFPSSMAQTKPLKFLAS